MLSLFDIHQTHSNYIDIFSQHLKG